MQATTINPETGTQYSKMELREAFEAVENPSNWKLAIDSMICREYRDITEEAVVFFAGCRPTFAEVEGHSGLLRVKAIGYYAAVGA